MPPNIIKLLKNFFNWMTMLELTDPRDIASRVTKRNPINLQKPIYDYTAIKTSNQNDLFSMI
jgi:hypothetical protein